MGKRLKKCPSVGDRAVEGTVSSVCEKARTRNADRDLVIADDSKVNSTGTKSRKVRKQAVTNRRKRPCVTDEPVNIDCDAKDYDMNTAVSADIDMQVDNVSNSARIKSIKSPAKPDCISPAAKLAKQLRCFKDKQKACLTHKGDMTSLDVFGGRHSPTEFTDIATNTGTRTRKRRGNVAVKRCSKHVNIPVDQATSRGECTANVPPSGWSTELANVGDDKGKKSRKPRGKTKVANKQTVVSSPRHRFDNDSCSDRQNTNAPSRAKRKVVGQKRPTKDTTDNLAGRKAVTKAVKLCVESDRKKTKQKQTFPRNRKEQPKAVEMDTEDIVTGGGNCSLHAKEAGPSEQGGTAETSSDSESEWEDVDELPGANLSLRDQLPTAPVEIILEDPMHKRGKKHKEVDIKTYFRRLMNRYKKETQLDMHKVHLLCLLCYGFHRNQICKDTMLQAVALSMVPVRFTGVSEWDVNLLRKLTGWFNGHFSIGHHLPGNTDNLVAKLVSSVSQVQVTSQAELVFVFIAMLRSLGLDVRLVISLQPMPIKAPDLDLKTSAGSNKKMIVSGRVKNKSVKKVSKMVRNDSCKISSMKDVGKTDQIKQEFNEYEVKQAGAILSAKISAKCELKRAMKKTSCEELRRKPNVEASTAVVNPGHIEQQESGRPQRRVSKVNYAEGGEEDEADPPSKVPATVGMEDMDEEDREDEELRAGCGKRRNKGRAAKDEQGCVQEISDDDEDFVEETVSMSVGSRERKPTRQKRNAPVSDEDDSVIMGEDGSATDHWAEVFLPRERSWICVDCMRARIAEPEKIERRATSPICYVVAFDNRNYVKDVTPRYASDWMHTTRKLRVSPEWWEAVLTMYSDPDLEQEKKENDELKAKFTEEPLPTIIGQYKNHPLYALKRHLLKFEAIYPPTALVLGYVRGEPVYSRECVHNLHSRETWLKEGLVVKVGEEPYKMVRARPKWHKPHENTTEPTLPIFGRWQTEIYVAPPAVDGKVPVNEYGNVELFQPTMLPAGTVHIRVPGLQKVAKKLNIDCPPAMTGWDFHGGYNHPVMDGWVVCEEHREILLAAWDEDQEIQRQRDLDKREARAVDNWKLLVKGLLIKQRLKRRYDLQEVQETASGSGGKTDDRPDPRPATDTALAWPQNRKRAQPSEKTQNRGTLFPFEMEHM